MNIFNTPKHSDACNELELPENCTKSAEKQMKVIGASFGLLFHLDWV